ncbi:hypothetical protein [Flavobacterium sp.]|jgi:hypothetical protein|uniref:hypothetical protein n=1 Tax=Flavobacterium sp. TaxID=239 RepID=UPI0037BEDE27
MAKRKYARMGEKENGYECTKRSCKWQGLDSEKALKKRNENQTDHVCPKCGNNEFYGLLNYKKQ